MKPPRKSVKVKSITVYKMLHLIALIDDGDDDSITPSIRHLQLRVYFKFPYILLTLV